MYWMKTFYGVNLKPLDAKKTLLMTVEVTFLLLFFTVTGMCWVLCNFRRLLCLTQGFVETNCLSAIMD